MWQAPQSLLHPTAPPPKQVSQARKDTYFRRVAMPERYEGPPPARWQRRMQVAGGIFSAVVGVYIVLFHDYGPREHVFSPVSVFAFLLCVLEYRLTFTLPFFRFAEWLEQNNSAFFSYPMKKKYGLNRDKQQQKMTQMEQRGWFKPENCIYAYLYF